MVDGTVGRDGYLVTQKKYPSGPSLDFKMSVPEAEGGQDDDDILSFPGDGFQDPEDGDPPETMEPDLHSGVTPMTEEAAVSGPTSAKKHKKSVPVPPDEFVGDRVFKTLKTRITGLKSADNPWTQTLRDKLLFVYYESMKRKLI
jgi:hypothetical protein